MRSWLASSAPTGLGFLLGAAHRARRRAWEASLSDLDLTAPQAAALRSVAAHPGMGLRELSRALVTDVMNARRLGAGLVAAGLCEYRIDLRDARRRPLYPTEAGLEVAEVVARRAVLSEQHLSRVLGPEVHATVVSALRRLTEDTPTSAVPTSAPHHDPDQEIF